MIKTAEISNKYIFKKNSTIKKNYRLRISNNKRQLMKPNMQKKLIIYNLELNLINKDSMTAIIKWKI